MDEKQNEEYEPIQFTLTLSQNKMFAYVRAENYEGIPEEKRGFDPQIIYDLANQYGVKYGIDDEAVKEYANGRRLYQDLELAHGKEPIDGVDAKVRYLFDLNASNAPKENEDGTVNYKELGLIQNVSEKDLICKITPPKDGEKGINVLGDEVLPKEGKTAELNLGQGVVLTDDGLEVRATMEGRVVFNKGTIEVSNIYTVKGDVGPETGNIRFNGSVVVQGNVMSDYSIFAKGDIVVNGYVEASMLNATGNVIIANGMNGMKKGFIKADGNITVKFAEMAKLIAGGDILCDYSINSDFRANRNIVASGKKGSLLGGSYLAGNMIEAKVIGSELNISMDLQIVPDWMHEVGFTLNPEERIANYKKAGQEFAQDLADCEKGAAKMEKNLMQISQRLQKDLDRAEMEELKQKVLAYNQERTRLKEAIEEIKVKQKVLEADLLCEGCKIVVKDIIHTGVRIVMGTQTYRINGHEKIQTYLLEDGEIKSYGIAQGA